MTDKLDLDKQFLDPGDSIFELIEFGIERNIDHKKIRGTYGVNVAKVREVVRMPHLNPLSSRTPGIAGIFELRGVAIPAVHLARFFGDESAPIHPEQKIIVTEFSQKRAGFIVDSAHRIRRINWDQVLPPKADASTCINGMTMIENNEFLFILDLERILMELEPHLMNDQFNSDAQGAEQVVSIQSTGSPSAHSILLIDDSDLILKNAKSVLTKAGFSVITATNGKEGLDILENQAHNGGNIELVVSDIEMPRMDGLTLTKKIREHATLSSMPIIFHSSLSGKANQSAGLAVGGNGYVIKNDFKTLIALISEILGTKAAASL